jgi:xanthine dehydrogenase YagR molybdenum-binding subunit
MKDRPDYHIQGIEVPETPSAPFQSDPWSETTVIGTARPKVDAYERVSGSAVYPSDVVLPRMLYGAILRCPHPHATIRSVDGTAARALPGVQAVLTRSGPHHHSIRDHAALLGDGIFPETCLYEGDAVAAVAAENPYLAADAIRAIAVEYAVHPFVVDERRALDADAPLVHATGNQVSNPSRTSRGDVARGFAEADVVLEESYRTECQIHTPMEFHGCVARWDGDALTVWESTQGVFRVQSQVAAALRMPLSKVRVIGHYMGGGFGSKLEADKSTLIAALLAKQTARPVKLFLTREETLLAVGNRPPSNMHLKAGVKRDGTLTALEFVATGSGGAYRAGGTSLLDWLIRDLYACPNVSTETTDLYMHTGPARPFRAPGHPQTAWALEQMMDALARAIGMDPVEFRLRNIPERSFARGGAPFTTTGLEACLREGAEAFGWAQASRETRRQSGDAAWRRGVGMAAGLWAAGDGGPPSTAIVKIFADGSVNLNMGASDIGTGTKTVMAMVVAEELGVDPDAVQIEHADTGTTAYATSSGGSKTVPTESPAVRAAAQAVKAQVLELAAEQLGIDRTNLALEGGAVVSSTDPTISLALSEVRGIRRRGTVTGVGYRGPNPEGKVVCPFAAQFCEVEVNIGTGEVRILRFLAAHDSGRVMNRLTYQNQVFGGITMGIGFALTEARILDGDQTGKMVNRNLHDYKVPTALDVPTAMECHPIDRPDDEANTTGAKGIGEPATIPTAAAIANAIHDATGLRLTSTTINPARIVAALHAAREGA